MQMYCVLVISGVGQLALVSLGFLALASGWGLNGVLWMQAIAGTFTALGFLLWLFPLLRERGSTYTQPLKPVLQLGFSAWQTNLVSGALFKQISIILLSIFVAGTIQAFEQIALFNIAFQLADAANVLLVAGFSGVGASALAAAYVGNNYERLARSWEVLIKITTLLAAPGLVFCLFNSSNIIQILYNPEFYSAGSLLAIFLFFNLLYRLAGSTIHQASLYVINKPHFVVISQWTGLALVIVLGSILIPSLGAAGALIADGIAKVSTGVLMLIFLLPHFKRKYALDLLGFLLRFIAAAVIAALPCILWQPTDRFLLVLSGLLFVGLCLLLLLIIKPLSRADIELLGHIRPQFQRYFRWFARG
jgi:O-antigen/teichoic acid export membrane protein